MLFRMLLKKGNDLWKTFLYDYNPGILIGNPVAMDGIELF